MKISITALFLLAYLIVAGQNLVPNPGFEEVTGCPGASIFLQNTNHWHRLKNHSGSPDQFYGNCDYNGLKNSMAPGQHPFKGQGYVGQFCHGDNLREYLTVKLCDPMIKDSLYEVSFNILPAAGYGTVIDSYGVHFSGAEPEGQGTKSLATVTLEEHVGNPNGKLIKDTIAWTQITGVYKAKGGEKFATFGNFRSDMNCQSAVIKENCIRSDRSYMLLDGVVVKKAILEVDVVEKPKDVISSDTLHANTRELVVRYQFETQKRKIELLFWDHLKQDGDTVKVMFNDSILIDHQLITKKKRKVDLLLDPGTYYLKLFAVNLGEIPPNTCAIRVSDGKKRRTYVLNSDLGKTEAIRIVVE